MQSIETSKGEPTSSPPESPTKPGSGTPAASKSYRIGMIAFAVFNFLGFVGIIVGYLVFVDIVDTTLSEATEICNSNADGINIMEDVPMQLVETWAYNITNPTEYLDGGDARVHELGRYAWNFHPELENIEVNTDTMEFDLYNQDTSFNKAESCDTCEISDPVFSQFTPYSSLIGAAKSEAGVLMAMTCSVAQIQLITSTDPSIGYCTDAEKRTAATCRCCARVPTPGVSNCTDLVEPSTRGGGLLSWIAKYDGGQRLSSGTNPNFPFSDGQFTGLIRKTNIKELTLGHTSTLIGFFKMNQALQAQDSATVTEFAKNTNDMKDACAPLNYCESMLYYAQQMAANPTPQNIAAVMQSIDCSGLIPSADELENTYGLTHERSLELRYLEGTDCRPYGLTLAMSAIIYVQNQQGVASYSCANSEHSLPCCMSSFSAPALGGAGSSIGCLGWANGFVQARNLFSLEEARKYILPAPHAKSYTACAEESLRFKQEMWHGRSEWNSWFVPDTYTYPSMPWADFSYVSGAVAGTTAGSYTEYDLEGTQMAIREGRGITTGFLEYDISDGEPKNKKEKIWAPFRLSALEFEHIDSFEYQELQVAYMKPIIETEFTDAEIERRQRIGEMPYPNQKNVAHSKGVPIVLGYPNFHKVNEAILSQSSNAARAAPDGAEIQLFRTRAGYDADSALLTTPERVTTASLETFKEEYEGDIMIEPATGVTLDARVVTMISNYVWQCNPNLESSCRFKATPYIDSDKMCYNNPAQGLMFPCSVTNVFTPKVHGGKVMPIFWIRSLATPSEDLVDKLLDVSDTRFALAISVIVLPVIFFVGFVFAIIQLRGASSNDDEATVRLKQEANAL